MNKKAQSIGSTITWMVATPMIVLILITFVIIGLLLFGVEKGGITVKKQATFMEEQILMEKIISFLETPSQEGEVADLIEGIPEQNLKEFSTFQNLAQDFLKDNFKPGAYDTIWMRVYETNEEIGLLQQGRYSSYSANIDYAGGTNSCDPQGGDVLFLEFPLKNKKIAICATYKK